MKNSDIKLSDEIHSINGVKSILDDSTNELLETLDSIDDAKAKKED